jgi:DNA-binding response OmpR family regulator
MDSDSIETGPITVRLRALTGAVAPSILLIDDDELERAFVAEQLGSHSFEVTQAGNGAEGLARLERQPFPLVLVDWMMPVMDGIAFTEQLRARRLSDVYVIMLTARDGGVDLERGYLAGVDDYLNKRVSQVELMARVHTGLSTYRLRRELQQTKEALAAARVAGAPKR